MVINRGIFTNKGIKKVFINKDAFINQCTIIVN